jgi:hypothetical protein
MNPRPRQTRTRCGIVTHWGHAVRVPVEGEPPRSLPAKRRKWRCELAVFLNGSDKGLWFFPIRAGGSTAWRFRWLELNGQWRTCQVVSGLYGTACSCADGQTGACDHICVLDSLGLLPE